MSLHGSKVASPGDPFARFNPGRYTTLPEEVARVMARRRVGANGWPVMLALSRRIYADGEFGTYGRGASPARERIACARARSRRSASGWGNAPSKWQRDECGPRCRQALSRTLCAQDRLLA